MANLQKTKERRKVVEKSLLDNPDMETRTKSPYLVFLHTFVLVVLFALLVVSYVFVFSPGRNNSIGKHIYVGSFYNGVYYNTKSCDLVKIEPYKEVRLAQKNDIVAYATNIEKGSGRLVSIDGDYLELEKTNGELIRITIMSVIGKQVETREHLGFFPAFLSSYYGVGILTTVIIVYLTIITFSRINYENTDEGKVLYKRFRKSQEEERERKHLLNKLKDIDGLDLKIYNLLVNDAKTNKENIENFDLQKATLNNKYKYILYKMHNDLIVQQELSKADKTVITSLIELMCDFGEIDEDVEYQLIDLALISPLVDFEIKTFKESIISYIGECKKEQGLINLGSVLYILVKENKRLFRPVVSEIIEVYSKRAHTLKEENRKIALGLTNSINNLINN